MGCCPVWNLELLYSKLCMYISNPLALISVYFCRLWNRNRIHIQIQIHPLHSVSLSYSTGAFSCLFFLEYSHCHRCEWRPGCWLSPDEAGAGARFNLHFRMSFHFERGGMEWKGRISWDNDKWAMNNENGSTEHRNGIHSICIAN